jgi:hypothetical protein
MPVPVVYRRASEQSIASYNFVDVAAGTGVVEFFLGEAVDVKRLSNSKFYSRRTLIDSGQIASPSDDTKVLDIDFDIEFVEPQIIDGKTVITIPMGMLIRNASKTSTTYIIAKVRKWDGTTETELASNTSGELSLTTTGTDEYARVMTCIDLDIPSTIFRAGETLRLTIEQYSGSSNDASSNTYYFFGCSPQNRATSLFNTKPSGS